MKTLQYWVVRCIHKEQPFEEIVWATDEDSAVEEMVKRLIEREMATDCRITSVRQWGSEEEKIVFSGEFF